MSVFAIADLHLSTLDRTDKSMEVFGKRWDGYITRIENNWKRLVSDNDTVVIPGDISWALSLEEAESDLRFLDSLPGRKILGKGNHDFWWSTMKKHEAFFQKCGFSTISFLLNNAYEADNLIIAGTRGWYIDEDARYAPENADFKKLCNRENLRLSASLKAASAMRDATGKEIVAFMHFPPFWNGKASDELIDTLLSFDIKRVYFGHIHGNYTVEPVFSYSGIDMHLISADYLSFIPQIIK